VCGNNYMTFFIIALKSPEHSVIPQCALDAHTCARRFSGCDVVALTDMPLAPGWGSVKRYFSNSNDFTIAFDAKTKHKRQRYWPFSLRYFVIHEYVTKAHIAGPLFNCDWDILTFANLPEYFKRVGGLETDLCSALVRSNGIYQSPMVISNHAALDAYVNHMWNLVRTTNVDQIFFCDITQWGTVRKAGGFSDSLTASQLGLDCYFDYNMSLDEDLFEMDRRGKKIFWQDNLPHFKLKGNDDLIKAVAMHTFIGWRYNTKEIMANLKPA
jgi:hypothetical protein